jgi:hypothetical protein
MKFNLVVEIDDADINDYMKETNASLDEVRGYINNSCYLGLGCIETIVLRQLGIEVNDTYVEKTE